MLVNKTKKTTKKFFILGGKWFDKANGNTYCKTKIMDTKGNIFYTDYEYGYGNYYKHSAEQFLKNKHPKAEIVLFDMGCIYDTKANIKNGNF